jgi:CxxC motif-containing protein (DUF1111 family)
MKTSPAGSFCCTLLIAAVAACHPAESVPPVPLGEPLAGLSAAELGRFHAGMALFNKVFTPEEGLGPLFNENQCSACHTSPVAGGTGEQFVVRASRSTPAGDCDPLSAVGGENVRSQATPQLRAHGIERQPFPSEATDSVRINVPYIFGLGLVEAIPEEEILARADPEDRDGDGISGRPGRDAEGRFARFGRKADQATLRGFVESAAHLEMGLTSPARPHEGTLAGRPFPPGVDLASDPELDETTVALLTDFVRFLAPAARRAGESPEDQRAIERGEALFRTVGCTSCHTPSMTTGRTPVAALDRKRVELYSDLLLHDMGPALKTVCAPGASPTELRTEPLMGLGRRSRYLHDSRTSDLHEAILLHGGEAAPARERFRALNELQRHDLVRFLRSL